MTTTTNPFPALLASLEAQVYLAPSVAFETNLWVLSGVLGFCLILVLTSLWLRVRRGTFWIYRLHPSHFGSWITPNPMVCWLLGSVVFLAMTQVFIFYTLKYQTPGADLTNAMIWRCVIWLPLWIGGLNLTWGTALAPVLLRQDLSHSNSGNYSPFLLTQHPHVVSIFMIYVHISIITTVIYFSVTTNSLFNQLLSTGDKLGRVLGEASFAFDAGEIVTVSNLTTLIQGLSVKADSQRNGMLSRWRDLFIVYSVFDGLLTIGFFFAAMIHSSSLRRSMRRILEDTRGSKNTERVVALRWGLRALIFTSLTAAAIGFSYLGLDIYIAVKVREVAAGSFASKFVQLYSMYIFAIFGTLSNIITLACSKFFEPATPPVTSTPLSSLRGSSSGSWSKSHSPGYSQYDAGSVAFERAVTVGQGLPVFENSSVKSSMDHSTPVW
ncbi:hypothetical protein P7C70_g7404, partial [Phenoliferia sp. Uapishka_3]